MGQSFRCKFHLPCLIDYCMLSRLEAAALNTDKGNKDASRQKLDRPPRSATVMFPFSSAVPLCCNLIREVMEKSANDVEVQIKSASSTSIPWLNKSEITLQMADRLFVLLVRDMSATLEESCEHANLSHVVQTDVDLAWLVRPVLT